METDDETTIKPTTKSVKKNDLNIEIDDEDIATTQCDESKNIARQFTTLHQSFDVV